MNTRFQMPSWKTGRLKRLRQISFDQLMETIGVIVFFGMQIVVYVVMILIGLYTPPTTW
jgi:hypothetical protein